MNDVNRLLAVQNSLEDALRLEATPEEVKETKDGKKLLGYLRRRRRVVNRVIKVLQKIEV